MQKNILEYLEATAARVPEKIAFSSGKESMSFGEVQAQALSIGTALAQRNL
jgi:non-ribosomal peptide synthetase component E (peptide arylation enzyme)